MGPADQILINRVGNGFIVHMPTSNNFDDDYDDEINTSSDRVDFRDIKSATRYVKQIMKVIYTEKKKMDDGIIDEQEEEDLTPPPPPPEIKSNVFVFTTLQEALDFISKKGF